MGNVFVKIGVGGMTVTVYQQSSRIGLSLETLLICNAVNCHNGYARSIVLLHNNTACH
jgi:hypothetical protein